MAMTMFCLSRNKSSTNQPSTYQSLFSMYNDIWQHNEPKFREDLISSFVWLQCAVRSKNRQGRESSAASNTDHLAFLIVPRTSACNAMEIALDILAVSEKHTTVTAQCLTNVEPRLCIKAPRSCKVDQLEIQVFAYPLKETCNNIMVIEDQRAG